MFALIPHCFRRKIAARYAALVFAFVVVACNVVVLPYHVAFEHHHDLDAMVLAHDHAESDLDCGDHEDGRPCVPHDASDHDIPASLVLVHAAPPVCSTVVIIVLAITQPLPLFVDLQWCPNRMDAERSPPGPSRAPPV